jgi:GMP synthase (glutamine-hydrolysing)
MYGAPCDAIRPLEEGEQEKGGFAQGWYKEVGFLPVNIRKDDPIFDGLKRPPVFFESHYWEIKKLPSEFKLLASSENVHIQCIKHHDLPIYGTQFHPEVNDLNHADGMKLLRNFFTTNLSRN